MTTQANEIEVVADPAAELEAMGQVARALGSLEPRSRERVISWASDFYLSRTPGGRPASKAEGGSYFSAPHAAPGGGVTDIQDIATLFARATPQTEAEKALVAGYFFQRAQGLEDFDSFRLNSELKHLGHGVTNITRALTALISTKPQLVVQTRKEGKSQQARKRYKLTLEGIKRVERMIAEAGIEA